MTALMVVDDEYLIRYSLQILLEQEGFSATTASTGREALGTLNERRIDAIILDIGLPDVNGLDLLKTIKRQYPSVTVIMATGAPNEQGRNRAMKLGASDYLEKPLDLDRLKNLLEPPRSDVKVYKEISRMQPGSVPSGLQQDSQAAAPHRDVIH